jgi:hypothetical protein
MAWARVRRCLPKLSNSAATSSIRSFCRKVLDEILTRGGGFKIGEIKIGEKRVDQSYARIEVTAPTSETLDDIVLRLRQHGAAVIERAEVQTAPAPADGVFPDDFYVTTNQQTFLQLGGGEVTVASPIMDGAIAVDRQNRTARSVKFYDIKKGDEVVIGHQGIRVQAGTADTSETNVFQFNANVSAETPKSAIIRQLAREFRRIRQENGNILVVGGPSIVHTGAGTHLEKLIARGFVQRLFTVMDSRFTTSRASSTAPLSGSASSAAASPMAATRITCARSTRSARPAASPLPSSRESSRAASCTPA